MSEHIAKLVWERGGHAFDYKSYSRNHQWEFENGATLEASAASGYLGDASKVDPEQAFVASLASCHMLTFLALAANRKRAVERYEDRAVGYLGKTEKGKLAVLRVELNPTITFAEGNQPDPDELRRLHEKAHQECFLANSVTCEIVTNLEHGK